MPKALLLILALLIPPAAIAQSVLTRCQTSEVALSAQSTDLVLLGCGDQYSDDVLWNLDRLDSLSGALDGRGSRKTTGRGAVVYVMDTGVERNHQELAHAKIEGLDALAITADPSPGACTSADYALHPCFDSSVPPDLFITTHGTAVASVVAGANTGVAPDAEVVSVRVLGSGWKLKGGKSDADAYVVALDLIVAHAFAVTTTPFRTAIVNISGGLPVKNRKAVAAVEFERKMKLMIGGVDASFNADPNGKRFLFVVAAGNMPSECAADGSVIIYPAIAGPEIDGLITVGGTTRDNELWSGSCIGSAVEILAPAADLLVASISAPDHYRGFYVNGSSRSDGASGTSYSAPYVSGIAARMLELNPDLRPDDLELRIRSSPSFVKTAGAPAGGRVAVLSDDPPPPRRRAASH